MSSQPTTSPYLEEENREAWTAWQCLTRTGVSIFLTGRAGTGKTTFLKKLRASGLRRMAIVAPTGVAAINAGGMTIHSLFQIPPQTLVPGRPLKMENGMRREKLRTIRGIDLLVIDEVSMVRPDLLDAVDQRLRQIRRNSLPFGGVQLLLIGDLLQLPPVVKPNDIDVLRQYYQTPFFFSARSLAQIQYFAIELKKVYRQSDREFIELLNRVRTDTLDAAGLERLNGRYRRGFNPDESERYIRLTSLNREADRVNTLRLEGLKSRAVSYEAVVTGKFPESAYPVDRVLTLKVDAQVMYLRNDTNGRYYNGKIGRVVALEEGAVIVTSDDGYGEIKLEPALWENISYEVNRSTGEIEQKVEGTFRQIPLALAWAITIHKSQGLTFDRAIIDAANSFSAGQVYVALSRCRTFEGMVLSSMIPASAIRADREVQAYMAGQGSRELTQSQIESFAADHALTILADLLNFRSVTVPAYRIYRLLDESYSTTYPRVIGEIERALKRCEEEILVHAKNYVSLCRQARAEGVDITSDEKLMERTRNGAKYFENRVLNILDPIASAANITLDNASLNKELMELRSAMRQELALKHTMLRSVVDKGFDPMALSAAKALSVANESVAAASRAVQSSNGDESEVKNQELYRALKLWRKEQSEVEDQPLYTIVSNRVLMNIADIVPISRKELSAISGMGRAKIQQFGESILEITNEYHKKGVRAAEGFEQRNPAARKVDTRQLSVDAFGRLGSIEAVARERGLAYATVAGHLLDKMEETGMTTAQIMGEQRYRALRELLSGLSPEERHYNSETMSGLYSGNEVRAVAKELGGES